MTLTFYWKWTTFGQCKCSLWLIFFPSLHYWWKLKTTSIIGFSLLGMTWKRSFLTWNFYNHFPYILYIYFPNEKNIFYRGGLGGWSYLYYCWKWKLRTTTMIGFHCKAWHGRDHSFIEIFIIIFHIFCILYIFQMKRKYVLPRWPWRLAVTVTESDMETWMTIWIMQHGTRAMPTTRHRSLLKTVLNNEEGD